MSQQAGYWVDLTTVKLDETDGVASSWIQMMPVGEWEHPAWGKISFTVERLANFAKNFVDRVRGTDIDIDYDHKESAQGGRAAGWLRQVEVRGAQGLWGLVEWTKQAAQEIRDKQYRYFSPEFTDEWKHPASGQTFKDVLFGGAITNRPFLKDILPINMTEVFGHVETQPPTGGHTLNEHLKKLAEALGVPTDGLDDAAITTACAAAVTKLKEPPKAPEPKDDAADAELIKLSEANPAIARLLEERKADAQRLTDLEARHRLSEVRLGVKTLSDLGTENGRGFGKATQDKLEEILVAAPAAVGEKVTAMFTELLTSGFVELGEQPTRRGGGSDDPIKDFEAGVAKLREANKDLSYSDAAIQFAADEPTIYTAYLEATMEGAR